MIVIPGPVEFLMGSPSQEYGRYSSERQHKRKISRTFTVAAKPVTVAQYRRFNPTYSFTEQYAPTLNCPAINVSWYDAAQYCNWLSKQEEIPDYEWIYETDPQGKVTGVRPDYLSRTGYRLPTEAEMEFVMRAGALTSRYYGESESLLGKYAWFFPNANDRTWPPGTKKPNDFGMFDANGNVWCWCHENYREYGQAKDEEAVEDREEQQDVLTTEGRLLRGGSFSSLAQNVRSATRYFFVPTYRRDYIGFRPARTFP